MGRPVYPLFCTLRPRENKSYLEDAAETRRKNVDTRSLMFKIEIDNKIEEKQKNQDDKNPFTKEDCHERKYQYLF